MLLVSLAACGDARGQWSGSIAIDSDHRFRGASLSDGHPSARAGLAYDHASGAYAGAAIAGVEPRPGRHATQHTLFAGRAMAVGERGLAAEGGVVLSRISGDGGRAYGSVYAGAIGDGWNLRLHLAPEDAWRGGRRTAYAEANGSIALASPARLFWHLGALHTSDAGSDASMPQPESRPPSPAARPWRADLSVGAAVPWRNLELRVAWVAAQRDPRSSADASAGAHADAAAYPTPSSDVRRSTLVLSLALFL